MKNEAYDAYVAFYKELGMVLKEGVAQDWTHREKIADVLLFESTKTEPGQFTTLGKYILAMPAEQKEIYYLIGESRALIEHSPYLENFKAGGQEVLLLTDPIDEFVVQSLAEYKGKKLKAVDKGQLDQVEIADDKKKTFQPLLDFMKEKLSEIKEARLSHRLTESAACLVADEGEMGAHMERLLRRMGRGQELPDARRILEVNADHPAVGAVHNLYARDPADPRLEKYCRLLYDQAVIAEGSKVKDPAAFAQRINELLAKDASA
jgi:molecular chaperone HtpG